MQAKNRISRNRKSQFWAVITLLLLLLMTCPDSLAAAEAQGSGTANPAARTVLLEGGMSPAMTVINGPPTPPPGYELERAAVALPEPNPAAGTNTLTVPAFNWVFGCSSVSGAMIAGYYDRNGYANMYTGPTNGGVMPLNNSSWPTWSDGFTTYPNLPLAASHNGVDGRTTRGSIDDYWIQYASSTQDPFITNGWTEHTWSTAIGDYMKTSQSTYLNTDGSTNFWNYSSPPNATQLTCAMMPGFTYSGFTVDQLDGTYGRKLFYEARGYTVTTCYNQMTDNKVTGGFSYAQFKAEIDAGRPVMINLYTSGVGGHTIVGVGYNDPSTIYIHDTWDYLNHTMTWGGSYSSMDMQSVSIVNLAPLAPAVSMNPTSWDFGNQMVGTTSGAKTFTLTNSGAANLNVGTLSTSGQFALVNDNCSGQTVTPSGNCTFGVTFSPLSTGAKSGSVSIPSNASTSPDSVSLSGTGTPPPAPAVSINPTSWDFGSQVVGTTSVIKSFTLTNSGAANLNVGMLSVSGQFALMGDNCSSQIVAPSATCTFGVVFSPTSTGAKSGSVSIPSNASTSPDSVSLSGTGAPPPAPAVSINPTSWDFGGQVIGTTSVAKTFTLTNSGTANLVVGSLTFTSDWILSNDTCSGATVTPGAACTFDVAFHPLAAGPLTGTIGIPSNAPTSPDNVALSGNGTAPAVGLSHARLDFGYQQVGTTSAAQTVTLTNTGTANLLVGSLTFTSDWILSNDTCSGATVTPGVVCTFDVAFHPLAAGALAGTIGIPSNAASSPDAVALTGTGYTKLTSTLRSTGTQDGWILETGENTNKGGTLDSTATTLRLGDDSAKKQYRSILSFATGASLPDTAVITKVTLKVKKQGITGGGNPVATFQGFMADIKKGMFGTSALQAADFQTTASKVYGPFNTALSGGWYSIDLTAGKAYINKLGTAGGLTQIRLRFKLDDNNNLVANYLSLYSGNAGAASRPKLIVEYYVP